MREETFYFIDLRESTFNGVTYHRLDFIDSFGNKYSVSCSSDMYDIITDMELPKFATIDIRFSVVPSYGKLKVSVSDINFRKEV